MSDQLKIDFGQLGDTSAQLHTITTDLAGTVEMSVGMAQLTGHPLLADAVVFFAERWNIQRKDMVDAVGVLRASMEKIITDISKTDDGLATQFGSADTGSSGGGGR